MCHRQREDKFLLSTQAENLVSRRKFSLSVLPCTLLLTFTTATNAQGFAVGEKVEIEASNHWVPCVVAENLPPSVMRVRCEEYPALSRAAGIYTVDRDNPRSVRKATGKTGKIAEPATTAQRAPGKAASGAAALKVGEYACYGSGGRIMAGLGFKVLAGNRYADLDGRNAGTFGVIGNNVSFRGGHLDGQTGRNLRGHSFTIASRAECEPF